MFEPTIIASERVYEGWVKLDRVMLRMPDGAEVERHIERPGSAVCVLPFDSQRRVARLVSMPRAAVVDANEGALLEVIAGALDGEAPEACARREALEEAGVLLAHLDQVGHVWTMPTHSAEKITLFLAQYEEKDVVGVGGGAPGENENITVCEVPLSQLFDWIQRGSLRDMKTLALAQALFLRRPDLGEA